MAFLFILFVILSFVFVMRAAKKKKK